MRLVAATSNKGLLPPLSGGLFPTLWPADHGDSARRKYVLDGGLPNNLDPSKISTLENPELPYPQWMYTRGAEDLFVYGVPDRLLDTPYFARVDPQTLEIKQKIDLPWILYMGGALVHANGDVYLVQGPHLYRFPGGDLSRAQSRMLPQLNGMFTQYNGLTVTDDGMLILKGWSINAREMAIFRPRLLAMTFGLSTLGAGAALGLRSAGLPTPLALAAGLSFPAAPFLFMGLKGLSSGASWQAFFRREETGRLLLVNPETLDIEQAVVPPERLAYGRMSMAPIGLEAELGQAATEGEYLVIPGDEHIHRWIYRGGRLNYDSDWTERYRRWGDGSFSGTGPAIWRQHALYTDNTAPMDLGTGYRGYRKSLEDCAPQEVAQLTQGAPGFMFWSTVIDPTRDLAFTWDSASGWIEARGATDFKRRWRVSSFNTDCATLQASHGHLYATDHSEHLPPRALMQSVARRPQWPHIKKDLIILSADDGHELLRLPLGAGSPVMGMLVPGYHNDLYVSTRRALCRVHQGD